ncbi:MAG: SPOR domain-containing protein [Lysobacter sp.]|nr:SPOR domain-containing protein [Lysobacter sp.]
MPNDPIAEQVEVRRKGRQRLVGAVVLALVAVVFVPMVLDPEPRRDRADPVLSIPPKDNAPPLTPLPQAPEPAKAASAPSAGPGAPAATPPAAPAPVATVEPKAAEFKPAPPRVATTTTAAKPAPPAPRLAGFAVQVGAFRDDQKLAQAREKLTAAKIVHYTERLDGSGGELTRLRAGPFPTREAADKAAAQLKRAGFDPRVVPLP